MTQPAIAIDRLRKTFGAGGPALDGVSLQIGQGEMVALIGASGSGKSTLLRHISGLVAGDRGGGAVSVFGHPVQNNGRVASDIRRLRGQVGFVFQQFNLVGRLSVLTNVLAGRLGEIALWRGLCGLFTSLERRDAIRALARVGIAERAHQRASTLSGGQQQRAAIARALVQKARVILADEPIASLDPEASRRVMEILAQINREDGTTVVVSLHQVGFALKYCARVIALDRGRVVYDGPASQLSTDRLRAIYGSDADLDFGNADPSFGRVPRPSPSIEPLLVPSFAGAAG